MRDSWQSPDFRSNCDATLRYPSYGACVICVDISKIQYLYKNLKCCSCDCSWLIMCLVFVLVCLVKSRLKRRDPQIKSWRPKSLRRLFNFDMLYASHRANSTWTGRWHRSFLLLKTVRPWYAMVIWCIEAVWAFAVKSSAKMTGGKT